MFKKILKLSFFATVTVLIATVAFVLSHYTDTAATPADCAVVFGAAVWEGNTPSHALYDRTMTGITLYKDGFTENCLILSGGPSAPGRVHEVDMMRSLAEQSGVQHEHIVTDHNGVNTLATIRNLDPARNYILISNDFHLARITLLAWREDLTSFATHASAYNYGRYIKEPQFFFREVIAVIAYTLHLDVLRP